MKRITLFAVATMASLSAFAQNTFPTSGNVGIGTNNPTEKLHIKNGNLLIDMDSQYGSDPRVEFKNDANGANPYQTFYRWTGSSNTYYATRLYESGNGGFRIQTGNTTTLGNHTYTDAFTLLRNGNIGIGTDTPSSKLDIEGGNLHIGNQTGSNGQRRYARIYGYDANAQFYGTIHSNWEDSKRTFDIYTSSTTHQLKIDASANSGANILLLPGANLGVGTLNPSAKLDIEGGDLHIGNQTNGNGQRRYARIYGFDSNAQFHTTMHSNWEDSKRTFDIYTSNTTQQLKIDASANTGARIGILPGVNAGVGIGTLETGSHKLAVEGSIGAREIVVEAGVWSDFVFEKDYKLHTLEEVEQHINEKGHLPEIPNAEEVAKNGINLGEMDSRLLQKIEELTLYMIDMNKQLKSQTTRMEQLELENAELKKEISNLRD